MQTMSQFFSNCIFLVIKRRGCTIVVKACWSHFSHEQHSPCDCGRKEEEHELENHCNTDTNATSPSTKSSKMRTNIQIVITRYKSFASSIQLTKHGWKGSKIRKQGWKGQEQQSINKGVEFCLFIIVVQVLLLAR